MRGSRGTMPHPPPPWKISFYSCWRVTASVNKIIVVNSIQVSKRKPVTCSIDLFCYYSNVLELIVLASRETLREGILQPSQPSHQHHKYSWKLNDEWTILLILEHFGASTFLCAKMLKPTYSDQTESSLVSISWFTLQSADKTDLWWRITNLPYS